jgi:hypothetical protein
MTDVAEMHRDPTNVRTRVRREEQREEARKTLAAANATNLKAVANTQEGRALLWQQLSPIFHTLHDPNGLILARNVGEHDQAVRLWSEMRATCKPQLVLMVNENLTT